MKHGVTVGKFMPFHKGHKYLIEIAYQQCDKLAVLICYKNGDPIAIVDRVNWVSEEFSPENWPGLELFPVYQDKLGLDDDDSEGWARATIDIIGGTPDVAFTSEEYGPRWAKYMGCEHQMVDPQRLAFPVSGSKVRENPLLFKGMLPPQVWAQYCPRYLIVGAESTGKTTLAKDLRANIGGTLVEEFGRYYTEALPNPKRYEWTDEDFDTIGQTQDHFEDQAARWSDRLICDTNSLTTALFQEAYIDHPNNLLKWQGRHRKYDLVFLTDPETPFAEDDTGLRDESKREWFHSQYVALYPDAILLKGNRHTRVVQAKEAIENADYLRPGTRIPSYSSQRALVSRNHLGRSLSPSERG